MPSPRSRPGPNISRMRPVPVPRSSSERNGRSASAVAIAAWRAVGDVQPADAIPFGGMFAEIGLRGRRPGGPHLGQPLAIANDDRVGRIEPRHQIVRQCGGAAALGEAEECPVALAVALDQAGLPEQPEMPRDARLQLPQDVGEVGHGELGLGDECQDAQPGALGRRLQRHMKTGKSQVRLVGQGNRQHAPPRQRSHWNSHKDMFIPLTSEPQGVPIAMASGGN